MGNVNKPESRPPCPSGSEAAAAARNNLAHSLFLCVAHCDALALGCSMSYNLERSGGWSKTTLDYPWEGCRQKQNSTCCQK
jgi:hypothetical protein